MTTFVFCSHVSGHPIARSRHPIQKKTPLPSPTVVVDYPDSDLVYLAPSSVRDGQYEKARGRTQTRKDYRRVRIDGEIRRTDEPASLERYKKHDIEIVIDRVSTSDRSRISEAVEAALAKGDGLIIVLVGTEEKIYSSKMSCPECDITFEELQPRMFSFNSPFGACESCSGLGYREEIDPALVIPDRSLSIAEGALRPYRNTIDGWRIRQIATVAREGGFDLMTPSRTLPKRSFPLSSRF
jgi:excinuclease ABC subunit A